MRIPVLGLFLLLACGAARAVDPPVTSDACNVDAAKVTKQQAEAAFATLLKTAPPMKQERIVSLRRFLPVGAEAEVFALRVDAPAPRYRVFVSAAATPLQPRLVDDVSVWSDTMAAGTRPVTVDGSEDKSAKTRIHFAPPAGAHWVNWERYSVHVLACGADNTVQYLGQFQARFTTKDMCRILAVLLCALFYVLAACTSYQIHRAGQKYRGEAVARGLQGTNYASIWRHFDPVVMSANQNGRGSATKLQILFFSLLVFGVLAYIWMATGNLSNMSETVLLLMGISGLSATAAGATEVARKRLTFENWAWLINRKWLPEGGAAEVNQAEWKDIFMTNNEFDVSRFQMIIFSVLVGMSLLAAGGATADLSDFEIPAAFLGILGLSQAVYIAGKLVDGPSIGQLDQQITALRAAEANLQAALAGTPDPTNLRLNRQDLPADVGKAYDTYMETWDTTRTMFQSTLSESVSAVAQGFRPPFPYLSLPADALAALERRHADAGKRLKTAEAALPAETIKGIDAARADYTVALAAAQRALAALVAAQNANTGAVSLLPGDVEARVKSIAAAEHHARTALDQVRQSVAKLEGFLAQT